MATRRRRARRADATGRSKGSDRFVSLPYWLLESEAARHLPGSAFKVLVYLIKRFHGTNNGQLGFGTRSGCLIWSTEIRGYVDESIALSKSHTAQALRVLEEIGFIECMKPSSFGQKRLVREWRLTWLAHDGQPPTREFTRWRAPTTTHSPVRSAEQIEAMQASPAHTSEP